MFQGRDKNAAQVFFGPQTRIASAWMPLMELSLKVEKLNSPVSTLWEIFSLCARNRTSENSVGLKRFSIHVDVNPSYWHLLIGRQPPHSDKLLNRIGPPMNKLGVYQSWLNINYCFDQKHRTVSMLFVAPMFATAASRLRFALCRCSTKLPLPRCPVLSNQWDFQEPKLEVPTIYKAYIRPM